MANLRGVAVLDSDIAFLEEQFAALICDRSYRKPSEYVESVRYIEKKLSPFPGRFSYDRFPYFVEIVDQFSQESPTRKISVMKGNQLGATTGILEAIILYNIGEEPKSQLYVLPTMDLMRESMKVRIEPMIDGSGLRDKIFSQSRKAAGAKATGDTGTKKEYPGGYLHGVGGLSANSFRNFSYPDILVDEIDKMPMYLAGEGSWVNVAESRTDAFPNSRKMYFGSTPTEEQSSQIWKLYQAGTQKKYFVPCKFCGEMQELKWAVWDETNTKKLGGIDWENDAEYRPILESVGYRCPYCSGLMKNYDKVNIIKQGVSEWRSTVDKPVEMFHESYHITPLYNPPGMLSWEDLVTQWAACWDIKNNKIRDRLKYQSFRNLKQGLPFRETHEQISWDKAVRHRRWGFIRGDVPNSLAVKDCGSPILILICSVDVQKSNLWVDVKGYCAGGVCWTIDFFSIDGAVEDFNGPWEELATFIDTKEYASDDGKFYRIALTLVDSGKYTDWVYSFCGRFSNGVYSCKGMDFIPTGETYKLFNKATLDRIGLPLAYSVNTTKLKDRVSRSLNNLTWNEDEKQPDWYFNFPDDFRDDYFRQFSAEEKIDEFDSKTNNWKRTYWRAKGGAANHAFDTFVYNLCALEIFADDICRLDLGLSAIDWQAFWRYAGAGIYWFERV